MSQTKKIPNNSDYQNDRIITGADQPDKYLPLLKGKKVGVITNRTGIVVIKQDQKIDTLLLVNFLLKKDINVQKIFTPEHGFDGNLGAGERVTGGKDVKTGVKIVSLYGKNKKPTSEQLKNLDVLLFDIQDVGVRFYTYISTLQLVMEAAAEVGISIIVLDRPNPNGHYIDGPVLKSSYQSFVGMGYVPVVYGMTIGEYAQMANGEGWLKTHKKCDLTIIKLKNYTHQSRYSLPVPPSPNLKSNRAINLYPSICFFEGTNVSEGRGTDTPFEVYGSPYLSGYQFSFTPKPNSGAKTPIYSEKLCYGENLHKGEFLSKINLNWLIKAYKSNKKQPFFNENLFFDKLAGTSELRKQIIAGKSEEEIRTGWKKDLEKFKEIRKKYLLYE